MSVSIDRAGLRATPDTGATDVQGTFRSTLTAAGDAAAGRRVVSVTTPDGVTTVVVNVAGSLMLSVLPQRVLVGGDVSVVVTVVDEHGAPVPGVAVSLDGSGPVGVRDRDVTTGADGRASTTVVWDDGAQPGLRTLVASAANSSWDDARAVLETVAPIDVSLAPMLLSPGATGRLSALVRDASAAPASGISVALAVSGTGVSLSTTSAVTNSRGTITADVLVDAGADIGTRTITVSTMGSSASVDARVSGPSESTPVHGFTAPHAVASAGSAVYLVDAGSLAVLNATDGTVTSRLSLGSAVVGRAIALAGTSVAYVADDAGRVHVCDLSSNSVRAVVAASGVTTAASQVSVHSTGRRVFSAVPDSNALLVVDTRDDSAMTLAFSKPVGVASGRGDLGFFYYVVDADGFLRYFTEGDNHPYSVLDLGVGAGGPMVVSSDGERGWIAAANGTSAWLVSVNLREATVVGITRLSPASGGIAISDDDAYVFVTTTASSSSVAVFATDAGKIAGAFDGGAGAVSVAVTPGAGRLFVANDTPDDPRVTVIETGLATASPSEE